MKDLFSGIYEIARPFGRRRLASACGVLVLQAIMQLVSVLSILPFLSAAADMTQFRHSRLGTVFFMVAGDVSNSQALWIIGGLSIVLLLLANALTVFSAWHSAQYAHYVGDNTRRALLKAILNRKYEYFLNLNSSELIKKLVEDTNTFSQYILIPTLDIVARSFVAILLVATLALVEPALSLWTLIIVALYYFFLVRPARAKGLRLAIEANDIISELYFEVNETIGGIKPILSHDARGYFHNRVARVSNKLARTMPKALLMPAIPRAGLEIVVFGGMIAWLLTLLATGGDLTAIMPGVGLIALVAYRLMPSMQTIFAQSVMVSTLTASMDGLLELLREQDIAHGGVMVQGPAATALHWSHEIRFEKVSFNYAGSDRVALHDVDFAIQKGQKIAFVGATGSGKSTLIDLLLGLLEPSSGRILIDGNELTGDHLAEWRAAVGYVPQVVFLLNTSVAENIAFGEEPKALDMARVNAAATAASAMDFVTAQGGFESNVGERGVRLSGGQRQRLALARAVYRHPSVLVLDEATSALDPKTEHNVIAAIAAMSEDLTVVHVAHRLTTIKDCDLVYFLREGRIEASGTFDALSRDVPAFRTFANQPENQAEAP